MATVQDQLGDVQGELDTPRELEGKWHALACDAVIRTEEHRLELDVVQDVALATVNVVSPMRVTAVVTPWGHHGPSRRPALIHP